MKNILSVIICLVSLTACSYGASVGQSGHASARPTMECLPNIDCPGDRGADNPPPMASADAYPLHNPIECALGIPDLPVRMKNTLIVEGEFILKCVKSPTLILITARLEYKNSAGNWIDESPLLVVHQAPPPGLSKHYFLEAACYPGWWRMEVHWSGVKNDGKTPFPNPADGDTPANNATTPVRIGC